MPRFAANLTFLFTELPFLDRFAAARRAGWSDVFLLSLLHQSAKVQGKRDCPDLTGQPNVASDFFKQPFFLENADEAFRKLPSQREPRIFLWVAGDEPPYARSFGSKLAAV